MQRSVIIAGFALTTLVAAVASAETFDLRHGPRTPAAAGTVNFDKKDKGDNKVSVEVKYLPPISELSQQDSKYVVWFNPGGGRGPTPVGTIDLDKDRNGKLDISTPFQSFDVMVTAEQSATPMRPSNLVILRGHVGKPGVSNTQNESEQGQSSGSSSSGSSSQGGGMSSGSSNTNPPPAQPSGDGSNPR